MIIQNLQDKNHWQQIQPQLKKALIWLQNTDLASLPTGRAEIDGDDMFAVVQRYDTADAENVQFESHSVYADVQYLVSGQETILICHSSQIGPISIPYDVPGDIVFYEDPAVQPTALCLSAGEYAAFFPEDIHKTRCNAVPGQSRAICKVIVKIKL